MKLTSTQAEVQGNLVFKRKFDMRISDVGRAIIIKSIIDMYSNPYAAVLREYTSNALDSHVWAGKTIPVQVTLPTRLSPNFIVQDWGIGLSADELEDYSQFGESTKRDTNDQIGGFGLGSKSGLAVSSRFTVEAVKGGKRSVVVIGRDAAGPTGGILVEDEPSGLPDGLKVSIPTSESYKFERALAHNFFLGWRRGSIEINGEEPTLSVYDRDKFEELNGLGWLNIDTSPGHWSTHDHTQGQALLGPVSYRIDWREIVGVQAKAMGGILKEVVVKLDNGSVDLTPSREALIYSKRTRAHVLERVNAILEEGQKKYQALVDQAPSLRDAMIMMLKSIEFGFNGNYTYHGKPIEMGKIGDDALNASYTVCTPGTNGPSGLSTSKSEWKGQQMLNNFHFLSTQALGKDAAVLVVDCEAAEDKNRWEKSHKISGHNNTLIRALGDRDNEKPHRYSVTYSDRPASDFPEVFTAAFTEVLTAEQAKELTAAYRKSVRSVAAAARITVKHDQDMVRVVSHYIGGRSHVAEQKIADLDKSKTYIVLKSGEEGLVEKVRKCIMFVNGYQDYGNYLGAIIEKVWRHGDYVFLLANKNWKTEKYSDYLPKITTFAEAAHAVFDEVAATLTPIQRLVGTSGRQNAWATYLGGSFSSKILRDELREYIRAANDSTIEQRLNFIANAQKASAAGLELKPTYVGDVPADPCADYPLLNHISMYSGESRMAAVDYINMIDTLKKRVPGNA